MLYLKSILKINSLSKLQNYTQLSKMCVVLKLTLNVRGYSQRTESSKMCQISEDRKTRRFIYTPYWSSDYRC